MTTTTNPHTVTGPTLAVWSHAQDALADIANTHRLLTEGDRELTQIIDTHAENPLPETVQAHLHPVEELIGAAQAYRRDLLRLLALAGGYDQPQTKEAA